VSDLFVKFPGVSGEYVSSADINICDGDTAHAHQSVGLWRADTGAPAPVLSADHAYFGDTSLLYTMNGTSTRFGSTLVGTGNIPVAAGLDYTTEVRMWTDEADREAFIIPRIWEDTTYIGDFGFTVVPLIPGQWTVVPTPTGTATAPADNLQFRLYVRKQSDESSPVDGEKMWVDAASVVQGPDPSFVPSLRIVGDLDMRVKAALTSYDSGVRQAFLETNSGSNGYYMMIDTTARFRTFHGNGSNAVTVSGLLPVTAGSVYEFRSAHNVTTGAVEYFLDGASQSIVYDVTGPRVPGGVPLNVGAFGGVSFLVNGDIYWAEVRDGIDGPVVARFDAQDVP